MSVDISVHDAVASVVINRPDKLNALTLAMREELASCFASLKHDEQVRAVIVKGAGGAFCSGGDVAEMGGGTLRDRRQRIQIGGQALIRALCAIEKPVVAAVRGPAVGLGWSIALACDMVVASETARFSQAFSRMGLAPDGGSPWFLTRRIGVARAKELAFSARSIGGAEALAMGLAEHAVPDGEVDEKAAGLAVGFARGPTFALGLTKVLFNAAPDLTLDAYLDMESLVQPQLGLSMDHGEAVAAFREKRPPRFTGR